MSDNALAKRNVAVMFVANAIMGPQMLINIALGGLAGGLLAPNPALATLPITIMLTVSMFTTAPMSLFMGRYGRRAGFYVGAVFGMIAGGLSALGLMHGSFLLFVIGTGCAGVYQATQGYFRFAATDTATDSFKPKAISLVLGAGLVAALIGPRIADFSKDMFAPTLYAGAFVAIILLNIIGLIVISFLRIPKPPRKVEGEDTGRPMSVLLRQPKIIIAIICAMITYSLMTLVMTSSPLAMAAEGFDTSLALDAVGWHVIAMFGPSFFTGFLIARFGHIAIIGAGMVILTACALVNLAGVETHHFYGGLILLGVGWNFGFIGSTALLTTCHTPQERAKLQGMNDFLVLSLVALASLSSGVLMNYIGWQAVNYAMIPAIGIAVLMLVWLFLIKKQESRQG